MPLFEIEQYELHIQKYRVEAENEADAIKRLLGGEADAVDCGLEYVEVAEDFGLPLDEYRDLAEELLSLDVSISHDVIPSIRSIEQVEEA